MQKDSAKGLIARCPVTGKTVHVRPECLALTTPTEMVCPACDRWHLWNPKTERLTDAPADSFHPVRQSQSGS